MERHFSLVLYDVRAYVSCQGYVGILQSVWLSINQGGTASYFVLDKIYFVRDFFISFPDRDRRYNMIRPNIEEIRQLKETGMYKVVPVCREILSDVRTPIELLKILKNNSKHCYMLESASADERWGRYTFLGYDPKLEVTCVDGLMKIGDKRIKTDNPSAEIRKLMKEYTSPKFSYLPSFTGGLVGYFSYDYLKYSEPTLRLDAKDTEKFNDVDLMLFDKVIAYDNFRQKIMLIKNIKIDKYEEEYQDAIKEIDDMVELIRFGEPVNEEKSELLSEPKMLFSKEEYCSMVERAKYHIKEGDIFQIVLSNRMEAEFKGSLIDTYRILRTKNPSPYMFYFSGLDVEVAGASPETLVKLEDGVLHTFPLAGTRPRGKNQKEDEELKASLLADEKECAEHEMLVDLGRNDIGRISKFGTVEVESHMDVLNFSHVMHIGSTVRGIISDNKDSLDAIEAILPAGTLSGAPKIKACQLINDLENNKRGIYGGAIGYIDFTGNLDTCIAIRIAYKKNNKVFVRSGAGIVYDSIPENEYRECVNKAAAVMESLKEREALL